MLQTADRVRTFLLNSNDTVLSLPYNLEGNSSNLDWNTNIILKAAKRPISSPLQQQILQSILLIDAFLVVLV